MAMIVIDRKTHRVKELSDDGKTSFDLGTFNTLEEAIKYIKGWESEYMEFGLVFLKRKEKYGNK